MVRQARNCGVYIANIKTQGVCIQNANWALSDPIFIKSPGVRAICFYSTIRHHLTRAANVCCAMHHNLPWLNFPPQSVMLTPIILGEVWYIREKLGDQYCITQVIGQRINSTMHSPWILTHRAFVLERCRKYPQITPWP